MRLPRGAGEGYDGVSKAADEAAAPRRGASADGARDAAPSRVAGDAALRAGGEGGRRPDPLDAGAVPVHARPARRTVRRDRLARHRRRDSVRHPRRKGSPRERRLGGGRGRAGERPSPEARAAGIPGHHRRVPVRIHRPRALRRGEAGSALRAFRVRGAMRRQRRDARSFGQNRRVARARRGGHGGAERHDGRAREGDPRRPRRGGVRGPARDVVRGQILLGPLRPVQGCGGIGPPLRRPALVPDGSGERGGGAPRGRA